jgi:hypothetical protein
MSMSEAMKPTPPPFSFQLAPQTEPKLTTPKGTGPGRGRPKGSKNKVKEPELGTNPSQEFRPGTRPRPVDKPAEDVNKAANEKAEKKARAEDYSKYITEELNDKLFMVIVGLTGGKIKAEAFYKEGSVPPSKKSDERLSDFGNAIAIPGDMADSWGKLLAELSYTKPGKGAVKFAENNPLGILGAAIVAAFSTVQYVNSLKPIVEYLKTIQQEPPPIPENKEE